MTSFAPCALTSVGALLLSTAVLSACQHESAPHNDELAFTRTAECPSPGELSGGDHSLKFTNTTGQPMSLYVVSGQDVYAVWDRIGAPSTRDIDLHLPNGTYQLVCAVTSTTTVHSADFTVRDSEVTDAPHSKIVTEADLLKVLGRHQELVGKQVDSWRAAHNALVQSLQGGDRTAAQQAWTKAYLEWRKLDDVSRSSDDSSAVADLGTASAPGPDIEGYHRIEWILWHGEPLDTAIEPAQKIADLDTKELRLTSPEVGLRTHEVTEEFERSDLRGLADFGSHTTAATALASNQATHRMLDVTHDVLKDRYDQLDEAIATVNHIDDVARTMQTKYADKPLEQWSPQDKAELDHAYAHANELLANAATNMTVRRI